MGFVEVMIILIWQLNGMASMIKKNGHGRLGMCLRAELVLVGV